jgi:hypothetical protein
VATEATALAAGAVGNAAVLTGATSPAGGIGSAALGRTPWGPTEMTQLGHRDENAELKNADFDLSG